jgi:hypothetical protein
MPRGGEPEDDLQVAVRRGAVSARRSRTLSVVVVVAALAAAAPGGPAGIDETHLEVGGPARRAWLLSGEASSSLAEGSTTSTSATTASGWGSAPDADPSRTSVTLALVVAEVLAPVQALSDSGVGVPIQPRQEDTTSSTAPTSPTPPTTAPTATTRPPTSTTRPPTTTTGPPTTTTRPPTTTTTTRPPTTTTLPAPCTWSGQVQAHRTGFVFDGQSNALSPDWERSFGVKLIQHRWPSNPFKLTAVRGTTYLQRMETAPERVVVHAKMTPCTLLVRRGGESDMLNGAEATEIAQRVKTYIAARRDAGFDVVVVPTIPPTTYATPANDQQRRLYNDLLRRSFRSLGIDVLVDLAAIPELQDPTDARWFYDGAHYTDEGSSLVADAYSRALP